MIYDGRDTDDIKARVEALEKLVETVSVVVAELSAFVTDDGADGEVFETQHQRMMSRRRMEKAHGV